MKSHGASGVIFYDLEDVRTLKGTFDFIFNSKYLFKHLTFNKIDFRGIKNLRYPSETASQLQLLKELNAKRKFKAEIIKIFPSERRV